MGEYEMNIGHFKKYIGQDIKVRLTWAIEGRKNLNGKIEKVDDDNITIMMDGEEFEFPASAVKRANLIYSG